MERTNTPQQKKEKTILLDYDAFFQGSAFGRLSLRGRALLALLEKLRPQKIRNIIMVSSFSRQEMDKKLGHLPLRLVAENGAVIRNEKNWTQLIEASDEWKFAVIPILFAITRIVKGTTVMEHASSVRLSYPKRISSLNMIRNSEEELRPYLHKYNLQIIAGTSCFDVMPAELSKGKASLLLAGEDQAAEFVAIGGESCSEEIFRCLLPLERCMTMKIGGGFTLAKNKMARFKHLLSYLREWGRGPETTSMKTHLV
jgi:trehalose 6-phosphate synthase/phosphatase